MADVYDRLLGSYTRSISSGLPYNRKYIPSYIGINHKSHRRAEQTLGLVASRRSADTAAELTTMGILPILVGIFFQTDNSVSNCSCSIRRTTFW